MIELRWVVRHESAPQYGEGISVEVKVLQYRITWPPGAMGPPRSEWMDVPTVRESDDGRG